jgi:hypothetical protein
MSTISTKKLATILSMTEQGIRKLIKRLSLPIIRVKTDHILIDLQPTHDLTKSLAYYFKHPNLLPIYSLRQLAKLHNQSKCSVMRKLKSLDIPTYGNKKRFVFLSDIVKAKQMI